MCACHAAAAQTWRLPTVGTALAIVEAAELSLAWSSSLVLGDKDGAVYAYDWETLLEGKNLDARLIVPPTPPATGWTDRMQLHSTWIERLSLCKEAGGLLSSSSDGTIQLNALGVHGDLKVRASLPSDRPHPPTPTSAIPHPPPPYHTH